MDFSPTTFVRGATPTVSDVLNDDAGNPVDLTGCSVSFVYQGGCRPVIMKQTRTATVTDAAGGGVAYTFQPGETNSLGAFLAQWVVTFPDASVQIFPPAQGVFQATPTDVLMKWPDGSWHAVERNISGSQFVWDVDQTPVPTGGWEEFTIISGADVTLISDLFEVVRAILGDIYEEKLYEDCALASVVRSVVRTGQMAKCGPAYSITPDNKSITPQLASPATLALCVYLAAKMILLPNAAASSYRTRAFGESMGRQQDFLFDLQNILFDLQNPGGAVSSFQSFYGWVNATVGLNIYALMTDMQTSGSVATVTIGRGGLQVNAQM